MAFTSFGCNGVFHLKNSPERILLMSRVFGTLTILLAIASGIARAQDEPRPLAALPSLEMAIDSARVDLGRQLFLTRGCPETQRSVAQRVTRRSTVGQMGSLSRRATQEHVTFATRRRSLTQFSVG
jgi:hypothetical protein